MTDTPPHRRLPVWGILWYICFQLLGHLDALGAGLADLHELAEGVGLVVVEENLETRLRGRRVVRDVDGDLRRRARSEAEGAQHLEVARHGTPEGRPLWEVSLGVGLKASHLCVVVVETSVRERMLDSQAHSSRRSPRAYN